MRPVASRWVHGFALASLFAWDATVSRSASAQPLAPPTPAAGSSLAPRSTPLAPSDASRVGAFAAAVFREQAPQPDVLPAAFGGSPGAVYVAARANGRRLAMAWHEAPDGDAALRGAVLKTWRALSPAERAGVTMLEINLAYAFTQADPVREAARFTHVHRGLRGIQLVRDGLPYRFAPTEMIAMNLSFDRALERLAERAGLPGNATRGPDVVISLFEADQLLVRLAGGEPATTVLYRGNTLVPIEAVTRAEVEGLSRALGGWMSANLQPDGRMVYLYWPSRGEESSGNNEIRQWMATLAITRYARAHHDRGLLERAKRNIRFNLQRSYHEDPAGHGLIREGEAKVKLGAVALACLALVEHPSRAQFAREEMALRQTVAALWSPSGEFRTFWQPADRADNVNFYPGEALLLWATLFEESRDPALRERILSSLRFYRAWHRRQRNPAFIPWHTQAYYKVWAMSPSDELRDWIFEMNDWLLGVQQWESQAAFPDTMGRFYDPDRPFGPPHASSTGVYLEGLIDAWRLAHATGDAARQERYRQAIIRGLRSVRQLVFLDDTDLFYISQRDRVLGGVRTTVYDNSIRVDNVQHNLMAVLKILAHLPAADFHP